MDVFASSLITWGMGVLVDVGAHHIHRSSSLVFSRLLSSSLVFVCFRGWVRLQAFCFVLCLTSGAPVLACHSYSRMPIRIRACVNRSTTHVPHLPMTARHGCHTRVVPTTHLTVLVPMIPSRSPPHCPSVLFSSVSVPSTCPTPRVPRETHSYPCSSPISPTLHFSITCSAPHIPPTAPVRRSGTLSPPTQPNSTPHPCKARTERSGVSY